jgi:hypothetical protein
MTSVGSQRPMPCKQSSGEGRSAAFSKPLAAAKRQAQRLTTAVLYISESKCAAACRIVRAQQRNANARICEHFCCPPSVCLLLCSLVRIFWHLQCSTWCCCQARPAQAQCMVSAIIDTNGGAAAMLNLCRACLPTSLRQTP